MKNQRSDKALERISTYFTQIVSLDLRSLAFMRIGLGVIILVDLINRCCDLRAHYSDYGVMPRWVALKYSQSEWYFSFHFLSGAPYFILGLFLVAGFFALLMILGCNTRFSTIMSWLLQVSVQNRNILIIDGGDVAFRLFLLIAIFLPLGARYSIDARRAKKKNENTAICSLASFAFIYQLAIIYICAGLQKTDPIWIKHYSAVYFAFSLDVFATPLAHYLLQYPKLLEWMTWSSLQLEYYGMLLLFIPLWNRFFRLLCALIFIGFHIGLALTLELGIFPYLMCVLWIALFPGFVWECLARYIPLTSAKSFFLNRCYPKIAQHTPQSLLGTSPNVKGEIGTLARLFLTLFLVYITLWNIRNINFTKFEKYFSVNNNWIADVLRLDQGWKLFAPYPTRNDGWYVIDGTLTNGERVDLWTGGGPVSYDKPKNVSQTYINQRWRKYLLNYWLRSNDHYRLYFAQYLCREWNASHQSKELLTEFEIFFMREMTLHDYKPPSVKKSLVWSHSCFAPSPE